MMDLEKLRKNQIDKINNMIIPATIYYPEKVKTFKTNLLKLSEIKKVKDKQVNEITRAKTKNDQEKISKLSADFNKQDAEEKIESNKMESGIMDFESERVLDNKFLLLHYIHSELAFHATAMEKLTKLFGEISCHEPRELLPVRIILF
jgi:hypothetical protein